MGPKQPVAGDAARESGRWVGVLPAAALAPGRAVRAWAEGTRVVVGSLPGGDGCFAALDVCPHLDLPLAAFGAVEVREEAQGERLVCPWHGWEFDVRTGRCEYAGIYADDEIFFFQLQGEDRPVESAGRLGLLPARLRDGIVEVDVSPLTHNSSTPSGRPIARIAEECRGVPRL